MDKFFEKIEAKFNKAMDDFDKSPIRTTIKWALTIWVVKKVWGMIKDED